MPATLEQEASASRAARHFLRQIRAHNLFAFNSRRGVFTQCFSWGMTVHSEDIDHARAFAEALRERYGNSLYVRQHLAQVAFALNQDFCHAND